MSDRETIHKIIDTLPEERLSSALDYLTELGDDGELSTETKAAIQEGLDDLRGGRTITIEELRRNYDL